jgi:FkbM family methyltransferase
LPGEALALNRHRGIRAIVPDPSPSPPRAAALVEARGLQFRVPAMDNGVGRILREAGAFADVEQGLIAEACDGDLLDVGANIGAICLPFARARPSAQVVAIEAHPGLHRLLADNAALNRLGNVSAVHAAAGEAIGRVQIPLIDLAQAANHGAATLYAKGLPTTPVDMRRIDDLAPAQCRFAKIDVEGFEDRVLKGAPRLLNEVRPQWLVEVSRHRPNTTELVRQTLAAAGYRLFWFFSPWTTPVSPGAVGDTAIFATDEDPPWDMRPVGDRWPVSEADFPYLARFAPGVGTAGPR